MKKIHIIALALIALGVLTVAVVAVLFHPYTYAEDGTILGNWLDKECKMHLEAMKTPVVSAGGITVLGIALLLISRFKSLKKQDISALLFIALGTLTIIGFLTAFYPCTMMMNNRPMRCYWTMRTLLGVAGAISVSGVLMLLFNRSKDFIKGLNGGLILLCGLFLIIPTKLTGICIIDHDCTERFYPFALMMGGVMLTVSVLSALLLKFGRKEEDA